MVWDTVTVEMVAAMAAVGIKWAQSAEGLEVLTTSNCVAEAQADGTYEVFRLYDVSDAEESSEERIIREHMLTAPSRRTAIRFLRGQVVQP